MPLIDKLGVCQWFHYQAEADLERAVQEMHELGVRHVRTGVSWADFHRPLGRQWYDRQMKALEGFEVLLSVWHTPPSIAEGEKCAGPPLRLADYADFIEQLIDLYGHQFSHIELWNEPNNRMKWDFKCHDPTWEKFGTMIRMAANRARRLDRRTVLGGMIPVDHHWVQLMKSYGALEDIDVIAIHGFPGMWWADAPNWDRCEHWHGWEHKVHYIREYCEGRPIWITETGLATWDRRASRRGFYDAQVKRLEQATSAPVERIYWYSLIDLDARRDAIEGFHVDEHEYHLGLAEYGGDRKPSWRRFRELLQNRGGRGL